MTRKLEDLKYKIRNLNYRGRPLFGRDSDPQNTSEFVALAGTLLFWLLAFIFFLFARPFEKKQEFKTVQIVLSSTPVAKAEKKESASSSAAAQKAQSIEKKIEKQDVKTVKENPAPAKSKNEKIVSDKPAAKNPPKNVDKAHNKVTETQRTAPQDTPFVSQARDMTDESSFFRDIPEKSPVKFNDGLFSSDDEAEPASYQPQKVTAASSAGGTAAEASASRESGLVSTEEKDGSISETASSSTTGALSGVRNAKKFVGNAGSSHSSELSARVSGGNGKSQIAMTDGSSRGLLEPSEPRIDLSEEAANLIDSTINVTIFIEVQPSGNITSVDFSPASILPALVQNEIRSQIAGKWRFERADYSSMGKFQYTIKKL